MSRSPLLTLTTLRRRQAEGCTTLVETQIWLPPDYEICSVHLTEVACSDAVLASGCPRNKVASTGAGSLFTAAPTASSIIPQHPTSPSHDSPSVGKSGLKLGLGLCFGVLAVILIAALCKACVTKPQHLSRSPRTRRHPHSTSATPRYVMIGPRPQPPPASAHPVSGSSSPPRSSDPSSQSDSSSSRSRQPSVARSASDLTSITWSSEGQYDRISDNRRNLPAGPNNVPRDGNQRVRQWVGEDALVEAPVVDVPVAADAPAVVDMEQIQNPEAQRPFLRHTRALQDDHAGRPLAPPPARGRVQRKRVHFQPTVEDVDESVG